MNDAQQDVVGKTEAPELPRGELVLRTVAMPADTNPSGDIFGGWLLSQMDLAGGMMAKAVAKGRTATVAVDSMVFHRPVHVGDIVCCYAEIARRGTTSVTVHIQAWAVQATTGEGKKVTEGDFVFVALDDDRRPRLLPR